MLDQVRPEGGTPGMLWLASELAGAEKASHANCAVVSQRALAAAVAWWWQCMAECQWKKGQEPQWGNECARVMLQLHLFVYTSIATWLAVSVVLVLD